MGDEALCNRLVELRAERHLTQQDLASLVDVTRQTIIAIEKGQYNPSLALGLRIAAVFSLPLESIFWLNPASRGDS